MPSSSQAIGAFRLHRHHLSAATSPDAVTICGDICGVQAQVMTAAYIQLWARNSHVSRTEVDNAMWQSRTLVKTSLMRQTLHLIPSAEFSTYISALKTSRLAAVMRVMDRFKITGEEADDLTAAILDALSSGPRTQPAITAAVRPRVSARVGLWMDKVWSILRIPVAQGLICYGPGETQDVNFIRVDQWLPKQKAVSEAEAQVALLAKYLCAYGPATVHDFSYWSGISVKDCRPIFSRLEHELASVGDGRFILARDRPLLNRPSRSQNGVKLLPAFDAFLLGHRDKDHLLDHVHYKRVYRSQGWITPVILAGGRAAGTWSHKLAANRLVLEFAPFTNPPRAMRTAIESEGESLAGFFGKQPEIRWVL